MPKMCSLFCLVDFKKCSFLTSCVFCLVSFSFSCTCVVLVVLDDGLHFAQAEDSFCGNDG